jgi:hypothetical protein
MRPLAIIAEKPSSNGLDLEKSQATLYYEAKH